MTRRQRGVIITLLILSLLLQIGVIYLQNALVPLDVQYAKLRYQIDETNRQNELLREQIRVGKAYGTIKDKATSMEFQPAQFYILR